MPARDTTGTTDLSPSERTSSARQLVLVPRLAGPVRSLDLRKRHDDDLDEFIDEMFGETTEDGPGPFDAFLVLGGLALLGWGWFLGGTGPQIPAGIVAIALGSILPARALVRGFRARSTGRKLRTAARDGYLLDVSHPAVATLVADFEACLAAAPRSGFRDAAVDAAHQALFEVATLLDGAAPSGDAELAYIKRRSKAIQRATKGLRGSVSDDGTPVGGPVDDRALRASAVTRAIETLEEETGFNSLDQMKQLELNSEPETDTADETPHQPGHRIERKVRARKASPK